MDDRLAFLLLGLRLRIDDGLQLRVHSLRIERRRVGAEREQRAHRVKLAVALRNVQRRAAFVVLLLDARSERRQQQHDVAVIVSSSSMHL